ncbi:MAG: methyltransferase domain-containing protein [Dehalococcoidales bacterium]|nr:MAG: methyltransferase domain-containing protein [Dehalococcoidales bacterium]
MTGGKKRYTDYDDFAWMYNRHWGSRFTPGALAVLGELVLPEISAGAAVLDLCCGTGQLASYLSVEGYNVAGIDGSEEMLKYARENAPGVDFICDDARTFNLPTSFDLVTSFFDSLNHVMTIEELTSVFRNVFSCLLKEGLFIFDMNLEPGFLAKWQGYYGIVEEDHVCLFPQSYDPEKRIARFDATMFRLSDYWYRSDVTLLEKCYSAEEISNALSEAEFFILDTFEYTVESGRQDLTADSGRAFFLCEKPGD